MKSEALQVRFIDRFVFGILAMLHMANGLYLVGPWYLHDNDGGKAPLIALFNSTTAVIIYGTLLFIDGLVLLYASAGRSARRFYAPTVSNALLAGFLLRLYALIGVVLTLESWRPPSYLSHMATVLLLGAYWVWLRINVRTIQ